MIIAAAGFLLLATARDCYPQRPKIGLVLSGGGAKGMAHIGVIREMERAGLRPDYITGTSMGSIVGGLYALGYTASELETIVNTINWDEMLTNKIDLIDVSIEEKAYYGRYNVELPVEGTKIGLPTGLIEGQKLSELLSRLTRSAHNIKDFNQLPIPFACMASDIVTGEPVLLNSGSLPECIRASMAIPTVFTPVVIDDKLLVDGGLVRNFPVQEVLDMGADIVIGIFVSSDLDPKEKLDNLFSLLMQSAWVTSAFDTREQKKLVDIYIEPNLEGYSTGSFKDSPAIIERGVEIGRKFFPVFEALADSIYENDPPEHVRKLPVKDRYIIDSITVIGTARIPERLVVGKLHIQPGDTVSIERIEKQINLIFGTRYFKKVTYQIRPTTDNHSKLIIKTQEATDGYLKLGAHYDSENDIGINANITYRNLVFPQSRALIELDLAEQPRLQYNYLKYTGIKQNLGLLLGGNLGFYDLPSYDQGEKEAEFRAKYYDLYVQFQTTSNQNRSVGLRVQHEWLKLSPTVGDSATRAIDKIRSNGFSIQPFLQINTMNRPFFPTRGYVLLIQYKYKFDINTYLKFNIVDSLGNIPEASEHIPGLHAGTIQYEQRIHLHKKITGIVSAKTAITSHDDQLNLNLGDYYFIGGFNPIYTQSQRFYGAQKNEYLAPNYIILATGVQYSPLDHLYITGIINYVDTEYPMKWIYQDVAVADMDGKNRRGGFGISLGYNSLVGPITVSTAKDFNKSKWLFNFNLGFWFK